MANRRPTANYWAEHGPEDAIEERWPYDGPHSVEGIVNGAYALGQLVRYLNNATQYRDRFDQPGQVHDVLMGVQSAVYRLRQLLEQSAAMLDHMGTPETTQAPVAAITEALSLLGVPPDSAPFAKPEKLVGALNTAVLACNRVETKTEAAR